MKEAIQLLGNQPCGWPRWRRGREQNVTSNVRHLFLYEAVFGLTDSGLPRAACYFVDGAGWVDYDSLLDSSETDLFCPHCLEVQLQFALKSARLNRAG